jgi:hypothetical protein
MNVIISGRLIKNNTLIGYRLVFLANNNTFVISEIIVDKLKQIFQQHNVLNCKIINNRLKSIIRVPLKDYPKFNQQGYTTRNLYTESDIIAESLNVHIESVRVLFCGALICGAITEIFSSAGQTHAKLYYEEVRHMTTDVQKIARNTGYSEKEILKVKNYLFMDAHDLSDGYRRFDESFDIAQSWQRLMLNQIEPHDLTLIKHELLEISLVENGVKPIEAHHYAENEFNYGKESNKYYDRIKQHQKNRR